MNDGYIKLHRAILDSNIFASAYGLKIWIWCLLKATYKTKHIPVKIGKGETIVTIQPGQFIFGRFTAEESLCIDGSTIYKWINKFKDENMIKLDSNSHYTIVTICKWDEYQQMNDDDSTAIQQPFNSHSTAIQQPRNTNKNIKESKEYKERKEYKKSLLSEIEISDFPEINNEYFEIAKSFQLLFKNNLIEAGTATTLIDKANGKWIDDVRLMIESDKYTMDDLRAVYLFLQKDAFWKQNILSISKLREKMPQLKLKIYNVNVNGNSRTNNKEATSWGELAQIVADSFANRS